MFNRTPIAHIYDKTTGKTTKLYENDYGMISGTVSGPRESYERSERRYSGYVDTNTFGSKLATILLYAVAIFFSIPFIFVAISIIVLIFGNY